VSMSPERTCFGPIHKVSTPLTSSETNFLAEYMHDHLGHMKAGLNRIHGTDHMSEVEEFFFRLGEGIGQEILFKNLNPHVVIGISEGGWAVAEGIGSATNAEVIHANTGRNKAVDMPILDPSIDFKRFGVGVIAEDIIHHGVQFRAVMNEIRRCNPEIELIGGTAFANYMSAASLEIPIFAAHVREQNPRSYLMEMLD